MSIDRCHFDRQPTHLWHFDQQLIWSTLLGVNWSTDIFIDSLQEPPLVALGSSLMNATVWIDGARPASTCILPSFTLNQAWDNAHQYLPRWSRWCNHHLKSNYWLVLAGKHWSLIQGKEGGIQVLAGLAPSSQTVGSNKERTGATKGGSWKPSFIQAVDELTPVDQMGSQWKWHQWNVHLYPCWSVGLSIKWAVDQSGIDQLTLHQ